MVRKMGFYALAVAAIGALLIFPGIASADSGSSMVGSVSVTLAPSALSDSVAIGGSAVCPGDGSTLCGAYTSVGDTYTLLASDQSITYNGYPSTLNFASGYSFQFWGIAFAGGEEIADVQIVSQNMGLTASDVTFGPNTINVDLSGAPLGGYFTLQITPTPEPGTLGLLGAGLIGLVGLCRRKLTA